ncbi:MAG TPA: hypothetical protein VMB53_14140 [Gaiellaceae bacterium]|nr:hypothetical protein [Gaiellaceae bacterium]
MPLADDLERIAAAAAGFAADGEHVTGVLAAEPLGAGRVYLVSYDSDGGRAWLALDDGGVPIASKRLVHDAVMLAGLVEVTEELAGTEPAPRVATPAYLDSLGADASTAEGFAGVVQQTLPAVQELAAEVERTYKGPLE